MCKYILSISWSLILCEIAHIHRYSGPGSQLVRDEWKVDFNTYMSSGLGYIVMEVDGYGSGGQGEEYKTKIKNRLGHLEVEDQEAALR